jgi:serine/threonine protein kinase
MTTQQLALQDDPQMVRARGRIGVLLQDKWRLEALLGVGGMAAVYAATHRNGKRVAVKMLHEEFSHDEEVRTRFLQEGYAANIIQHEGAVSVLDDDLAPDGSAFLVMELLEGETVDQRWERQGRRLPIEEALSVADQLLDVLAAAHAKNIVHRDVKPDNLLITKAGVLKVLDFGIAKVFERTEARRTTTRAGMVMGTPAFMAPEQARARWDEVDGRTDLWAVGATIFTTLSGRHVHEAESSHEQLIMSATKPAPPLASVVPGVPASVAAIVDRALAFDRAMRWPDASAMQRAIRGALDTLGGRAAPHSLERSILAPSPQPAADVPLPSAATMASPQSASTSVSVLLKERDARQAEATRLRTVVADLEERYAAAKAGTSEAQARLDAGQAERKSLEQWFSRRVGTRTAALGEARGTVRRHLVEIAHRAVADPLAFGPEFTTARERVLTLERAAASAARDVTLHEAALAAHDPRVFRVGLLLTAILVLALVVAPIVWRATRVIEPQLPRTVEPRR